MVKEPQTERIGIRVTPSEVKMLDALSESMGLSVANVIRQAIRREYAERIGEQPRPVKKPKK
jgi:hypothetical protein